MARYASQAEYYRAHRAAFLLSLELGCTPKEAQAEIDRRASRERCLEAQRRLQAKMDAPISHRHEPPADAPWMMRD